MYNYQKQFFSKVKAQQFCDFVKGELWTEADTLNPGQVIYFVKYN